jgi:hypothetical protein
MTLQEARRICEEIKIKYGIAFSDYKEEQRAGEIKLISLTLRFWINGRTIDFSKDFK